MSERFAVIVGNNDPSDGDVRAVVSEFAEKLAIELVDVHETGVSVVRNDIISHALNVFPALQWIALQDDDEEADENWLNALVQAGMTYGADMAGGYTMAVLHSTPWLTALALSGKRNIKDGPVSALDGTCNLLISSSFLKSLTRAPFDPAYGKTGGEDYEFFRYARTINARMIWTNEAKINEEIVVDRLSSRYMLARQFRVGAYMANIDMIYDKRFKAVCKSFLCLIWMFGRIGKNIIDRAGWHVCMACALKDLFYFFGRLSGQIGIIVPHYGAARENGKQLHTA